VTHTRPTVAMAGSLMQYARACQTGDTAARVALKARA
jgi:hypothetical protein